MVLGLLLVASCDRDLCRRKGLDLLPSCFLEEEFGRRVAVANGLSSLAVLLLLASLEGRLAVVVRLSDVFFS